LLFKTGKIYTAQDLPFPSELHRQRFGYQLYPSGFWNLTVPLQEW